MSKHIMQTVQNADEVGNPDKMCTQKKTSGNPNTVKASGRNSKRQVQEPWPSSTTGDAQAASFFSKWRPMVL